MNTDCALRGFRLLRAAALVSGAVLSGCSGQDPEAPHLTNAEQAGSYADAIGWEHPKTPWGEPDIRGKWPVGHLTGTPLQRSEAMGERRYLTEEELKARESQYEARQGAYESEVKNHRMGMGHWIEWGQLNRLTSLIVEPANGRLPELTKEGQRRADLMRSGWMNIAFDHPSDFDNWDRCITRGLPASMLPAYYNNGIQIHQAPGYVVIRLEMIHEARIIPTDGRPRLGGGITAWLGDSRGRWEGSKLIVETTNFNGRGSSTNIHTIGSPPFNNSPISKDYVLTETFQRTGPDTLTYTATVDDPVIWMQPWTVELPWKRDESYRFFEYACHEDNSMIRNYIETSRAERARQYRPERQVSD
ncbi:MAG: hypothetical protein PVF63_00990 [Gammaproteobacteria bacterium]|jgi:hypothetical protein